jgi:hypothetical protein
MQESTVKSAMSMGERAGRVLRSRLPHRSEIGTGPPMLVEGVYTMLEIGTHAATAGRKGSRWRRARAACLAAGEASGTPCYGCRQPINYALGRIAPRHPQAPTAHHVHELWQGGHPLDPANLVPCHYGCNARLSNKLRRSFRRVGRRGILAGVSPLAAALADPITSRQW